MSPKPSSNPNTNADLNLAIIDIIHATIKDYPIIQNMARFYVYDMSKECGRYYDGWEIPKDGLFECDDFKNYFENEDRKPFIIKVNNEIAGFVLIQEFSVIPDVDYNMGEFFILAKFQGTGIAQKVAIQVFEKFPGQWSVAAIPENKRALNFWRKVISNYTKDQFIEVKKSTEDLRSKEHPEPYPMIFMLLKTKQKE